MVQLIWGAPPLPGRNEGKEGDFIIPSIYTCRISLRVREREDVRQWRRHSEGEDHNPDEYTAVEETGHGGRKDTELA